MPLYTFYPTHSNGLAPSLETAEFDTDLDATFHAEQVLDDHASAASVVVCRDDRIIHTQWREAPPAVRSAPQSLGA